MTYDATILAESNLIAYYPMNEQSGTTIHDATSNHYDGTLHGGVTLGQAPIAPGLDPCALFTAASSGYISLPSGVQIAEPLTIEMWLKNNSIAVGGNIWYGVNDGSGHGYEFGVETTATPSFYIALNSGGTNSGNSDFATGTVYYVAVTIDASQNMTGYAATVGGSVAQKVTANPGGSLSYSTTVPYIGARYRSGGPSLYFDGYGSSVAVYGKLLSTATMNAHVAAGSIKYLTTPAQTKFQVRTKLQSLARSAFQVRTALKTAARTAFKIQLGSVGPKPYMVTGFNTQMFVRPFSTISSNATVINQSNVAADGLTATVTVTFPDNSTLTPQIYGLGNGNYQTTYTTKGVGTITELWTFTDSQGSSAEGQHQLACHF